MNDERHQNYPTVTGTPTLVAGATTDGDQALSFDGSTNSMTVADSPSDSLAVVVGGMALECFVKVAAYPGSTKDIIGKAGSFQLQIDSTGHLIWKLINGGSSVTVTAPSPISTGAFHHVVGVYNGDYSGTALFGKNTTGSSQLSLPPDYRAGVSTGENNLQVCKKTILENGQLTSVVMDLAMYYDSTSPEWAAAVVYADSAGAPGARLAQSAAQFLNSHTRAWVPFPVDCAAAKGDVWLGFLAGSILGNDITSSQIGYETSGGARRGRSYAVSDASTFQITGQAVDPFGTAALSDAADMAIYANYTPASRTGDEGNGLLYIDGVEVARSAYSAGIADTANDILVASTLAVVVDEPSLWNKKLTAVQVARHYSAR